MQAAALLAFGPVEPSHLIVVDDEADLRTLLAGYFSRQGYRVSAVASGRELLERMTEDPANVVLLDLGLPAEDGFAIARRLREQWRCGLIIVTGRGDTVDRVVGLEVGADDYVTKPFDLRELLARVKSLLRRLDPIEAAVPAGGQTARGAGSSLQASPGRQPAVAGAPAERLQFGNWTIDAAARRLIGEDGIDVELTGGEFDLLLVFARHPGRVLSRDFLLEQTRGRNAGPYDRTVDVQVGRLRRKLGDEAANPRLLKAVRGAGYLFVPEVRTS